MDSVMDKEVDCGSDQTDTDMNTCSHDVRVRRNGGHRQRGGILAEFIIVLPMLLLVALGAIQWAFIYQAKNTVNHATFMAARAGAVNGADVGAMRNAFARGILPLYSPDKDAPLGLDVGAGLEAWKDSRDWITVIVGGGATQMQILNPTLEAFDEYGVQRGPNTVIRNDRLHLQSTEAAGASGVSIQDANLLKLQVLYGYELRFPFISNVLGWIGTQLTDDVVKLAMWQSGRIPILSTSTVRMQSDVVLNDNVLAKADVDQLLESGNSLPFADPHSSEGNRPWEMGPSGGSDGIFGGVGDLFGPDGQDLTDPNAGGSDDPTDPGDTGGDTGSDGSGCAPGDTSCSGGPDGDLGDFECGTDEVGGTSGGSTSDPGCNEEECAEVARGIRYGELSQCIYEPDSCTQPNIAPGWEPVDPAELGLEADDFIDDGFLGGFAAGVYHNTETGEYTIVFRGTDNAADWIDNVGQGLGFTTEQYERALELARAIQEGLPDDANINVTGHSLGGGLATAAALELGVEAVVFNAAGLTEGVAENNNLDMSQADDLIDLYHVEGEILTSAQDFGMTIPSLIPPFTTTIEGPSAPGDRVPLAPPSDEWMDQNTADAWYIPDFIERAIQLHGMDSVMESLRARSEELGCP